MTGKSYESAWLVERGQSENHDPTVWWAGEGVEVEFGEWTTNAFKARRFATREEADDQCRRLSAHVAQPTSHPVEHGFVTNLCANCGVREGTIRWGDAFAVTHGFTTMWCEVCALTKQIEHAEERAALLPKMRARLEEISSADAAS